MLHVLDADLSFGSDRIGEVARRDGVVRADTDPTARRGAPAMDTGMFRARGPSGCRVWLQRTPKGPGWLPTTVQSKKL